MDTFILKKNFSSEKSENSPVQILIDIDGETTLPDSALQKKI